MIQPVDDSSAREQGDDASHTRLANYERANMQAQGGFEPMPRSTAQKVAIACQTLALAGHNAGNGLASQITAREAGSGFWTQRYGLALEEAQVSNQLLVDFDLNCVQTQAPVNPANRFHAWIYRRRPEVGAIVHTHAPHASALSMIGLPLQPAHMDSIALYGRVAHLSHWPGVPFGDEEGRIISDALGPHKAILLAHHGLLTVGSCIEEACTLAMVFEHTAQLQVLALSTGQAVQTFPDALASDARRFAEAPLYAQAHFEYYARRVQALCPRALL